METQFVTGTIFTSKERMEESRYQRHKLIAKHVEWLRNPDRPLIAKIGIVALMVLECLALAVTVVGAYFIYRGIWEHIKLCRVEEFNKMEKPAPPSIESVPLISETSTFNHINYYIIHEGFIWTKPIHETGAPWKPIYFNGKNPVEIQADGANLIVLDEENHVHYKKVISEWRDKEDDHYCYADKSTKNNWRDKWFSLPIFNVIANIVTGKILQLPKDCKGWAVSHRSVFNNYQTDAIGQKHVEPVGTTHIYALDASGKWISVFDPWIHKSAKIRIPLPNSAHSSFEATAISASASTIMIVGYELTKGDDGQIKRELKVYTRFVDVDILGWNPGVKYDYPGNSPSKDARVIPMPDFIEHPLQFEEGEGITGKIRIIQTGQGNDERILIAEGRDSQGKSGYFYKKIDDTEWDFAENDHDLNALLELEQTEEGELETFVNDYTGELGEVKVNIEKYGEGSYLSKVTLNKGEDKVELLLNRRKTLMTFLGLNVHKHEIALPKEEEIPESMRETLKTFFGDRKVIKASVNVQPHKGILKIKARNFNLSCQIASEAQ